MRAIALFLMSSPAWAALPLALSGPRGRPTSLGRGGVNAGLNPLYQIDEPRPLQLALRVAFRC
jgi:hypothetical protein